MKKSIYFLVALFLVSSMSGYTTLAIGAGDSGGSQGLSSHQTPDSNVDLRRLVELRQSLTLVRQHCHVPHRRSVVEIRNNTNQSLDVSLSGNSKYSIHVGAYSSKTHVLNPGGYMFEAQIPGFPPYAGQVDFVKNSDYSWVFVYTGQ